MAYYSAIKKNKAMSFARKWVESEIIMLSKARKTQADKFTMFSLVWGVEKKR